MGPAQTVLQHLIMRHLQGPMMDILYYSVRVQGLTLPWVSVLEYFPTQLQVLIVVQHYRVGVLLLQQYVQDLSHFFIWQHFPRPSLDLRSSSKD